LFLKLFHPAILADSVRALSRVCFVRIENPAINWAAENLMNRMILAVLAVASTSLPALPQTQASERKMLGDFPKPGRARQLARYATMLEMTFREFEAPVADTDIVLLPIGSIEEQP
jgi:hypothetical protein